jgi:hypothetical protein
VVGPPLDAVERTVRAQTVAATTTTTAATAAMTMSAGRELRPFSGPAAAGASPGPAVASTAAFGWRTFLSRGCFSLGMRGGLDGLPVVAVPASAASVAGCEREKKLGSEVRERPVAGGVSVGASGGAVGAVATDCGYLVNGVGLDPDAPVTRGGAGSAGAVGLPWEEMAAVDVDAVGAGPVGAGIVVGGGAVGWTTGGRCGSRAEAGEEAVVAERRGAA